MNKKQKKALLGSMLALTLTTGGVLAYLTDTDSETNTFTVGQVEIDLTEPNWKEENGKDVTPLETIAKDPTVTNTGVNDAFVFVEVTVPYANVITAEADGTRNAAADTELFSYTVNEGWVEIGEAQKDTENKTVTHVYAYGTETKMTALAKDAVTPALFDSVTVANIIENPDLETTTQKIEVVAKAIQTENVNGGKTSPVEVLTVYNNQNAK